MALNAEEKYRQKEYELKQQRDQSLADEREIIMLEEELNLTRNRLDQANHYIDKVIEQRDRVNGAINLYKRGKRSEGITLDDICMIMRHPL